MFKNIHFDANIFNNISLVTFKPIWNKCEIELTKENFNSTILVLGYHLKKVKAQ
jgi:hypothetical protein